MTEYLVIFTIGVGVGFFLGILVVIFWAIAEAAKMEDEHIRDYGA